MGYVEYGGDVWSFGQKMHYGTQGSACNDLKDRESRGYLADTLEACGDGKRPQLSGIAESEENH
jgi:hypothetical protein